MAESFVRQLAAAFFRTSRSLRSAPAPTETLHSGAAQLRGAFFRTSPSLRSAPRAAPARDAATWEPARQESRREAHPSLAGLLRLPHFDRAALLTAGTPETQHPIRETTAGDVRYTLRYGGQNRLQIRAYASADPMSTPVLTVTVVTPQRNADYLLLFQPQGFDRWVAAVDVPGFQDWADVWVHEPRAADSLDGGDEETVRRSVRAAPDPWVGAWQSVARSRTDGDPVRVAIEEALRS
jgi:hypothetical protein